MKVKIRAIPAPGHEYRWRCGKRWGKEAAVFEVVDQPQGPSQISPVEYATLQSDDRIVVVPLEGSAHEAEEANLYKARVVELEAEVARLRKEIDAGIEVAEEERRRVSVELEDAARKRAELEQELTMLRAKLSKKALG